MESDLSSDFSFLSKYSALTVTRLAQWEIQVNTGLTTLLESLHCHDLHQDSGIGLGPGRSARLGRSNYEIFFIVLVFVFVILLIVRKDLLKRK